MTEISSLPNKVLQHVFSFLNHQNRLVVREVCRKWNELVSTAQFTDRIWLRLAFEERNCMQQMTTFKESFQNYRHVVIDCHYFQRYWYYNNIYKPWVNQLVKLFTAVNNVETLVLFGMYEATSTELLILLQNVPKLKRLFLLGTDFLQSSNLEQACFSDYPDIEYLRAFYDSQWLDMFKNNSTVVLAHVNDVILTTPMGFNLRIESFQRMFPNLNQLQVTVNDPSIVDLIDACKDKLIKLSMCAVNANVSALFHNLSCPKLSHLYMSFRYPLHHEDITEYKTFFKKPCHARNLRELKLPNMKASIFPTICSSCTSLQVLDVCASSIDLLEYMSNLRNLQKLTIRCSTEPSRTPNIDYYPNCYQPIQSLKDVTIIGSFDPITTVLPFVLTASPNLEVLNLMSVGKSEESLRIISERCPNLRQLSLSHPGKPPQRNFGYLKNMTNLVSYSLTCTVVDDDTIQKWIQMAPNLSSVKISRCKTLTDAHLINVASCCPQLRKLELMICAQITPQGLKEFQQKFPHVTITDVKAKKRKPYLDDGLAYEN